MRSPSFDPVGPEPTGGSPLRGRPTVRVRLYGALDDGRLRLLEEMIVEQAVPYLLEAMLALARKELVLGGFRASSVEVVELDPSTRRPRLPPEIARALDELLGDLR